LNHNFDCRTGGVLAFMCRVEIQGFPCLLAASGRLDGADFFRLL
jgi:hypothetical protein